MLSNMRTFLGIGFLAGLAAGCSTPHSITPGIWSLKIEPNKTNNLGEEFARPTPRNVEVNVTWSKEEKGVELVRVQYTSRDGAQPVQRTLLGDIRNGEVTLEGADQVWTIWLKGRVASPESIGGPAFGRVRWNDSIYFSGLWTMTLAGEAE